MASSFGINFPKLTLCRSSAARVDSPNTTSPSPSSSSTTNVRTLSLSIKNVPSQPLHYDVSTTAEPVKKKTATTIANILAIDGETKQLPKNLSVFNELQIDDVPVKVDDKQKSEEHSNDLISVSSSLSKTKINKTIEERRSNHTFTPPTSTVSNDSLSNDLHLNLSSISVDIPQFNYAIEKYLDENDDPIYQMPEEFSSVRYIVYDQEYNGNLDVTKSDSKQHQEDKVGHYVSTYCSTMSNNTKWFVSELKVNRPLVYRTQWTNGQHDIINRKLSQSVNDLNQIYNCIDHHENNKHKVTKGKTNIATVYSTLSLKNLDQQQNFYDFHRQSDDNIFLNTNLSHTNDDLINYHSDDDEQYLISNLTQRTLDQSVGKDAKLIRNESVKKKLFDILNDDELENACLEDMSQEFEKISVNPHRNNLSIVNSFPSSSLSSSSTSPSSSNALLSSSSRNGINSSLGPTLSSSYNENLSTIITNTTERYFGRSRLITTSLDKIPTNNNSIDCSLISSSNLRPPYEFTRPSWYTSPMPHWRIDDQLQMGSILKRHSTKIDNTQLKTDILDYDIKHDKYSSKYHNEKRQKRVSYSLINETVPIGNNSTNNHSIITDKPSNLLMFI